jgi:dienelactone hydrolase
MQQSAVIEYNHDGYQCEGFAVWDAAGPNRPGILVFPEWVGVGQYTQKRAQMLGELGFNAFVVDVYGKGIRPNTPSACEAEMMKYATNRPLLRQRHAAVLTNCERCRRRIWGGWPRSATASAA